MRTVHHVLCYVRIQNTAIRTVHRGKETVQRIDRRRLFKRSKPYFLSPQPRLISSPSSNACNSSISTLSLNLSRNQGIQSSRTLAPKKDTNKRTIAPDKILNLLDFPQFIISVLTLQGLLGFVAIDELVYDELVYEFYDNLSWETKVNEEEEETPFLKSRVKKKTINLGIEEICKCFDIVDNSDGFETYDRHG